MSKHDDITEMIEDCETLEDHLDSWEKGFVSSVSSWFEKNGWLTEKQEETLIKIWDKVGI